MILAFIVLLVIAFTLGGYITFDVLKGKKKAVAADSCKTAENAVVDIPPKTYEEEPAIQPEVEIVETAASSNNEITRIMPAAENNKTRYIVIKYSNPRK